MTLSEFKLFILFHLVLILFIGYFYARTSRAYSRPNLVTKLAKTQARSQEFQNRPIERAD